MSNHKEAKSQKSKLDQFQLYFEFDVAPNQVHRQLKKRIVK